MAEAVSGSPKPQVSSLPGDVSIGDFCNQFFPQLVAYADAKLSDTPFRTFDGEDIAISALHSVCRGADTGKYTGLENSETAWQLLIKVAHSKLVDRIRYERAQKRGGGQSRGESLFVRYGDDPARRGIHDVPDSGYSPDIIVAVEDEFEALIAQLNDVALVEVAVLRLAGHSYQEIAVSIGQTEGSVKRKIQRIRLTWHTALTQQVDGTRYAGRAK